MDTQMKKMQNKDPYMIHPKTKKTLNKGYKAVKQYDQDRLIVVTGREGCQPKGEKVLMADGSWKNIENIKINDFILSPQKDSSHKFSKVTKTYKWKCNEIYKVEELNRNKKILYHCSYNHLIPINKKFNPRIKGERKKENSYWDITHYTSRDYSKLSRLTSKKNQTTLLSFPIQKFMNQKNCEIEPYTLGIWLGDGSFSVRKTKSDPKKETYFTKGHYRVMKDGKKTWQSGHYNKNGHKHYKGIRISKYLNITSNDIEIINEIKRHYNIMSEASKKNTTCKTYRFSLNGELSKKLIKYNLEGKGSENKFIPGKALTSDLEYRKKLLAGLIDSDGSIDKRCNNYEITLKSKILTEDIYKLVRSLGGRGSIKNKFVMYNNEKRKYYRLNFYLGELKLPVLLKRKMNNKPRFYLSSNRCSIDVIKTKRKEYVYGFTIDSESSWYITNDYVITHNTGKSTLAMQLAYYLDPTFCIDDIVFTSKDFSERVRNTKKYKAIVFDEAFNGLSSRSAISGENKKLIRLLQECRQRNLFIFIVLPSVFLLEKYVAIFRSHYLIHAQINKRNIANRFYKIYNYHNKKMLYILGHKYMDYSKPKIHLKYNFSGKKPPSIMDEEYEAKKLAAFKVSEKVNASEETKWRKQRDILFKHIKDKFNGKYTDISKLFMAHNLPLDHASISQYAKKVPNLPKNELSE